MTSAHEPALHELTLCLEQLQCFAILCDAQREIVWINQSFCDYSGYSLGQCLGQNPRMFRTDDTPPELFQELWSKLSSGQSWRGFFVNHKANGEKYVEECTISPFYTQGHQLHYLALYHNPNQRSSQISDFKWSKYFARHILEHFPNPIWTCDLQGHRDFFNSKWNQGLDSKHHSMNHSLWESLVHPEDLEHVRHSMQSALIRQHSFELLYRMSFSQGHYRWITEEILPHYDHEGHFAGFVGSCMDITESQSLQEILLSNKARIEAKGNYKSEIVENLSRRALELNLELLETCTRMAPEPLSESCQIHLDELRQKAQALRSTLYDLHEFARIEAHPPQLNPQSFCLTDLMMEIHLECTDKTDPNRLRFYTDFNSTEDRIQVYLDQSYLKKLIKILLENIIDVLERGYLRLGFQVAEHQPFSKLHIYIEGWDESSEANCTVNHHNHPRIAIAESMVTQLSGKLAINRKDCDHLNYELIVPLPREHNLEIPVQSSQGTILIADDDDLFALILEELLHQEGFHTKRAHNGKEAVEIAFADQPVHLVLMDLQMPVMNGFEATRIIKRGKPKLNVVALTGQNLEECLQDFLDADFADYLAKPYQKPNLLSILRHSSHKEHRT